MNPISAFFVRNIIIVFFVYGLAFFAMGLALWLASRRASELSFVRAIRPLAIFGILHSIHEWIEMFQKIATLTGGYTPTVAQEVIRVTILAISFLMLLIFGLLLLRSETVGRRQVLLPISGMAGLWLVSVVIVALTYQSTPDEILAMADVLARYSLGIPGALLGTWALMVQQRTFREHSMPQFGRDLVWCATALFVYGVIGQIFVRQTSLVPSTIINSTLFLQWFGIPVQLFRGVMAAILAFYMVRALNAFDLESQRRLETANQAKLTAQTAALESERRASREMERLNKELRLTAHERSLLLDLSNLLAAPMSLQDQLQRALKRVVHNLRFLDAGMILLVRSDTESPQISASMGFLSAGNSNNGGAQYNLALSLGERCITRAMMICHHLDGKILEFPLDEVWAKGEFQDYKSPMIMICLPLTSRQQVIGSIVLAQTKFAERNNLLFHEFRLMWGVAQQLGLSIENARLYQEAQKREVVLTELLNQVVGAQEAERQRIARELHDATGQSLTAIALGLRGVENMLDNNLAVAVEQIGELETFTTQALGELQRIIADLRPSQLDDLGLVAALQWYIQEFEKRYAIPTGFVVNNNQARLPPEYETVLFRIIQEGLTNVAKHAKASQATVKLEIYPSQVCVTIMDNGRGFDPEQMLGEGKRAGWGLLGIRERVSLLGGAYEIDSEPGGGASIRVTIPLSMEAKDVADQTVAG